MQIIGITGTLGAGKGEVVEYLKQKGFVHFSARSFLLEEVRRRGLPEDRDSTNFVGEDLRRMHSASYILENLYAKALESGQNCVLESVRTVGEIQFLRSKPHFSLLAVDADPKLRFERAYKRKSSLDNVTFEKFMQDEHRESISKDPARMNLPDCIALADAVIINNGTKEELYEKVEEFLKNRPM
jgi:dephospho-CoA kinase